MIWFINIAMAELILAIIIWALVERFGHVSNVRGKLASFGLFLAIWGAAITLHILIVKPSFQVAKYASARIPDDATSASDAATLAANKGELQTIVRKVIMGASVDQRMHAHFWSLIPASFRKTEERRKDLLSQLDAGMVFQKVLWESLLLSAQAHQVVRTETYKDDISRLDPSVTTKSDAMLHAAASGKPYTLSSGQGSITISEVYAKKVLSRLDASSARLNVLFNPTWHQ